MQTIKSSTSPKILNFQNGGKCGAQFDTWGQYSNAYNLYIVVKEILLGLIALRARVQKWTYFELLRENRRDMFLKAFSRNRQAMKNDLTKLQQLFN